LFIFGASNEDAKMNKLVLKTNAKAGFPELILQRFPVAFYT